MGVIGGRFFCFEFSDQSEPYDRMIDSTFLSLDFRKSYRFFMLFYISNYLIGLFCAIELGRDVDSVCHEVQTL